VVSQLRLRALNQRSALHQCAQTNGQVYFFVLNQAYFSVFDIGHERFICKMTCCVERDIKLLTHSLLRKITIWDKENQYYIITTNSYMLQTTSIQLHKFTHHLTSQQWFCINYNYRQTGMQHYCTPDFIKLMSHHNLNDREKAAYEHSNIVTISQLLNVWSLVYLY